jgi:GT2 family glycosyltransferase
MTPTLAPPTLDLVTIIITTFNRAPVLLRALESLAQVQTAGEFAREIVVVDNASTDDTRSTVEAFAATVDFPVRYAYEARQGLPFARNRGLAEAQGDWVSFFDDDQLAEPDWLLTLHRAAQLRGLKCVGGARDLVIEAEEIPPLHPYCRKLLGESHGGAAPQRYSRTFLPTTGNVLVHRSVVRQLGGFNNTWLEGGEDTNFFNRLIGSNVEAWFVPTALVHHLIPASRLEGPYLERTAQRHGVTMARRDLEEGGRLKLLASLVARLAHGGVKFGGAALIAKLTDNDAALLAAKCRLRRVEGYARFALQALLPSGLQSDAFAKSMMHRGSRVEALQEVAP